MASVTTAALQPTPPSTTRPDGIRCSPDNRNQGVNHDNPNRLRDPYSLVSAYVESPHHRFPNLHNTQLSDVHLTAIQSAYVDRLLKLNADDVCSSIVL